MARLHNLGFPRIGKQRELKFALEQYWKGELSQASLLANASALQSQNWQYQSQCDLVAVGDFSLYDHILDMSFLLGNIPGRVDSSGASPLDQYFRAARGRSANDSDCECTRAAEMTKWFDTNYHYIVPELSRETKFALNPTVLIEKIEAAKASGVNEIKPVIVGPLTYLWLSKPKDDSERLDYLDQILTSYTELFDILRDKGITWVQVDEPILVTELSQTWQSAFEKAYSRLQRKDIKLLIATYFGRLGDNLNLACKLPVAGLHIDAINAKEEVPRIIDWLPTHKVLSLGVVNGRNIWLTDLNKTLDWLAPIANKLEERLWIAPSCSLLHVPVDLRSEGKLDSEIKSWLAFAIQKLAELNTLKLALNHGRASVEAELNANANAVRSREQSVRVHKPEVRRAVNEIDLSFGRRESAYEKRRLAQKEHIRLPAFPTTTIGSFPQTQAIRKVRRLFKNEECSFNTYQQKMHEEIARCINEQESLGLDVLVHGEAERNDMVEYFGEQLDGYAFSQFGWVQSYGSRCVKPPILFGDITRPRAMTLQWTAFAQSITQKPVKGMLTGPVTILNWSFVRDDQPRSETCKQLALAIRSEVLDLERAGVKIIQIDEAALREGLPLRESEWAYYLDWAVESFRICANGVQDLTQIHTHMCYSEFNQIIEAIAHMDADVITIETSRSDMELLDVFDDFKYPNEIGPGVYDIHSPNIPEVQQMVALMKAAALRIPSERLWVNPDCGLKTRQWDEVLPALKNMVQAAVELRKLEKTPTTSEQDRAALV